MPAGKECAEHVILLRNIRHVIILRMLCVLHVH